MYEKRRRRRSIFDLMREYVEDLDAWADELVESMTERPSWDVESHCLEPLCNIFVATDEVVVTADLPYSAPDSIRVKVVSKDLIEIAAKMKRKLCFDDFGITHRKGEFSTFRCQVRIPVPVDTRRKKIQFRRGILEVRLPRKRGYRIKVE